MAPFQEAEGEPVMQCKTSISCAKQLQHAATSGAARAAVRLQMLTRHRSGLERVSRAHDRSRRLKRLLRLPQRWFCTHCSSDKREERPTWEPVSAAIESAYAGVTQPIVEVSEVDHAMATLGRCRWRRCDSAIETVPSDLL